jgi:phage FluMu protein gp41
MAQVQFDLTHGLKIGESTHKSVVLVEPTVADLLECGEQSERAVMTSQGPALVSSPTVMGALMLCRQIKSVGGLEVPFDLSLLKKLHPDDMLLLQLKAEEMERAAHKALEALTARGRAEGDGAGD